MQIGTKGIEGPGGFKFDKWEVLLGGGVFCALVGAVVEDARFLLWVGVALIGLWVLTVFLVNLGILESKKDAGPAEGGGTAESSAKN